MNALLVVGLVVEILVEVILVALNLNFVAGADKREVEEVNIMRNCIDYTLAFVDKVVEILQNMHIVYLVSVMLVDYDTVWLQQCLYQKLDLLYRMVVDLLIFVFVCNVFVALHDVLHFLLI